MTPWLLVAGDCTPFGGMDQANYALAGSLAGRGCTVHVVTHRASPDLASQPSVKIHHVWRPFGRHLLGGPLLARAGRRAWSQLRRVGAHAIVNGGNCPVAAANWVHYLHAAYEPTASGGFGRQARSRWIRRRDLAAERDALARATVVICNSQRTRADVIDRIGLSPDRVHVVYYGSDPIRLALAHDRERAAAKQALGCAADRPLVGFIGALGDRRKAFDALFTAWADRCRDRRWDADLVVVGGGAELPAWRARARAAGLGPRMRFLGFRHDVPQIVAALDALVHPARYEAYGLSVHEAVCRGVPALVTASAGVAERFPAALEGLLIASPDDPHEISERLVLWRGDLEAWRERFAPLAATLRARTWDTMAGELTSLVDRAA